MAINLRLMQCKAFVILMACVPALSYGLEDLQSAPITGKEIPVKADKSTGMQSRGAGNQQLTFDELLAIALKNHPSIRSRQSNQKAAELSVKSAKWQFGPSASIVTQRYGGNDPSYTGTSDVSVLRLEQPIPVWGPMYGNLSRAEAVEESSRWSLEEIRERINLEVISAYADWCRSALKVNALLKVTELHKELLAKIKRRLAIGVAAGVDEDLASSRLAQVESEYQAALSAEKVAKSKISQLTGISIAELGIKNDLKNQPPVLGEAEIIDKVVDFSPTINRVRADSQVSYSDIELRKASLMPRLYARLERQYGSYGTTYPAPVNRAYLGVEFSPGAGLSGFSEVSAASSKYEASLDEIDASIRDVIFRAQTDYADWSSLKERVKTLDQSMKLTKRISESYERQYASGRKSWLDLLNSAREISQAEIQLADAKAALFGAEQRLAIYASYKEERK